MFWLRDYRISKKKFAAATLLTSGTLAWFFFLNSFDQEGLTFFQSLMPNDLFLAYICQILFYSFSVFWALVGSFVGRKLNRRTFLFVWVLIGIFTTLSLPFIGGTSICVLSSIFLGLSLGLGLPSSLSFISENTRADERGRVSGIIIFLAFIMAFCLMILARIFNLGLVETILLSALLRSSSLLAFFIDSIVEKTKGWQQKSKGGYRTFLFYLFPWVLFNIASGLAWALIPTQDEAFAIAYSNGNTLRYICIAIFGLVSGHIADRYGRKIIISLGLMMLGLGFLLLGFSMSPDSVLIYLITSGIAWGSFFVVFIAVPGDLSDSRTRDRFYALGTMLPLAILLSLYSAPPAFLSGYSPALISQFLSFILFLCIIPIMRAEETLKEGLIYDRKVREYLHQLGKIIKKSKEEEN